MNPRHLLTAEQGINARVTSKSIVIFALGLIAYTIGVIVGYNFNPMFHVLGYSGVALMISVSIIGMIKGHHAIIPEIRIMWLFCGWVTIVGMVMAQDYELFYDGLIRLFQVAIVAFCVAGVSSRIRSPALGFGAILSVALLLGIYGLVTGDFSSITDVRTVNAIRTTGVRAKSMVSNANSLGVNAVWGFIAVTYLTATVQNRWLRMVLWASVPVLILSMIASGSRKALLLPIIYLVAWIWFCHRKSVLRSWRIGFLVIGIGAILFTGLPWVMENTFVGYRMQRAVDVDHQDSSTESRLIMAKEAVLITLKYPITGVGLSQWSFYGSVGGYAHSEYGEIAATTGVMGIFMYLLPYIMAVRRLRNIRRLTLQDNEYYCAGVCLALLVTVAFAGFSQVLFTGLGYWVLVGAVWGYAYGAERALLAQRQIRS